MGRHEAWTPGSGHNGTWDWTKRRRIEHLHIFFGTFLCFGFWVVVSPDPRFSTLLKPSEFSLLQIFGYLYGGLKHLLSRFWLKQRISSYRHQSEEPILRSNMKWMFQSSFRNVKFNFAIWMVPFRFRLVDVSRLEQSRIETSFGMNWDKDESVLLVYGFNREIVNCVGTQWQHNCSITSTEQRAESSEQREHQN